MGVIDLILGLSNLLFPPRCAFCGKPSGDNWCCSSCENSLPTVNGEVCKQCGLPFDECTCHGQKMAYDGLAAPFFYEGGVRRAILHMKERDAKAYHIPLADCMAEKLRVFGTLHFDFITCVPQSKQSAMHRGYNQSELLAKRISFKTGMTYKPTLACKRSNTAQKTHNAIERTTNIAGCFMALSKQEVEGRCILLVDDVKTTGSTVSECAKVLKQSGAANVYVVCAAVVKQHKK